MLLCRLPWGSRAPARTVGGSCGRCDARLVRALRPAAMQRTQLLLERAVAGGSCAHHMHALQVAAVKCTHACTRQSLLHKHHCICAAAAHRALSNCDHCSSSGVPRPAACARSAPTTNHVNANHVTAAALAPKPRAHNGPAHPAAQRTHSRTSLLQLQQGTARICGALEKHRTATRQRPRLDLQGAQQGAAA